MYGEAHSVNPIEYDFKEYAGFANWKFYSVFILKYDLMLIWHDSWSAQRNKKQLYNTKLFTKIVFQTIY